MARVKKRPRRSGRRRDVAGKFRRREAILVVLLFLALGAWGIASLVARNGGPDEGFLPSKPGRREVTGVIPGRRAPDFNITTAEGGTFQLSEQRGRVVVLDFLAPG